MEMGKEKAGAKGKCEHREDLLTNYNPYLVIYLLISKKINPKLHKKRQWEKVSLTDWS